MQFDNPSDNQSGNAPMANPWISMWTRPRETIQQIVTSDPTRLVLLLAALQGISGTLDQASINSAGDRLELPTLLAAVVIAGPVLGILSLYIGAALLRWTGNWIGGQASSQHIRTAIAWSSVPIIWSLLLWIPELWLFGKELFTSETPRLDADVTLSFSYFGFALVEFTIAVWALVVYLKCLGQVQGFSAWKALGNSLLAILVIVVPLVAITIGLTYAELR